MTEKEASTNIDTQVLDSHKPTQTNFRVSTSLRPP